MELIIVIVILGVLATLALTHYGSYQERALDREAQANLKLIVAAEKIYRMEVGGYYGTVDISSINDNLKLLLSTGDERKWDYQTTADNTVDPPTICAQATRTDTGARTWRMQNTDDEPATGACP